MSNGEVCCILGICCPPESSAQLQALTHEIQKQRPHLDELAAQSAAERVLRAHLFFGDVVGLIDTIPPAA